MKTIKVIPLLLVLFLAACSTDDGPSIPGTVDPDPNAGVQVQDFMWKAMNYWYFWQAEVPNLADDKFPVSAAGTQAYTEFLLSEDNPADFFRNQLQFGEDRFSTLNEDYRVLTQSLSGINKSNGLKFGLINPAGTNDIFGYVRYVIAGSDASTKNIGRGDLFRGVNGQLLTLDNYRDLLFGDNSDTYTLNMAGFENDEVVLNGQDVVLTKQEGLQENPIFLDKTFEIQGKKIGYLVYQQFLDEYDDQLNEVFGRFKSEGVTELVVDVRYNPGGSVNTTVLLGSMIHGTNTNNVFLKAKWNDKYLDVLANRGTDVRRFFKSKTPSGASINTLELNKVYVLATRGSASASELLINGLDPYMDVVHIGDTTRGKNEFSITLVDDRDNDYIYSPTRVNKIPANNEWALQPLTGRNENSVGFFDYTEGFAPEIELKEDLANLGVLGDLSEPLLAKAIEQITGETGKRDFSVRRPIDVYIGSEMFTPMQDRMYMNTIVNEK